MAKHEIPDGMNRVEIMPIPPLAERTHYIDAGPVTIGVEYRYLTFEMVEREFKKQSVDRQGSQYREVPPDLNNKGTSVHVCAEFDGGLREYVRFDCFESAPHYHYICYAEDFSGDTNHAVIGRIDTIAVGEAESWVMDRFKSRLPQMLAFAGRPDLANKLEGNAEFNAALPQIARAVDEAGAREVARMSSGKAESTGSR